MRSTFVSGWSSVLACVWAAGCDDEVRRAIFVDPAYDDPCRFVACSADGECHVNGAGAPECLCNVGYEGPTCDGCGVGFHRDARDRCVPDESCAEQDENPCGMHGECSEEDGVIICTCDEGYEGPRCTLCADRYARDTSDRCLPLFIVGDPGSEPASGGDAGLSPGDGGTNDDGMAPADAAIDADAADGGLEEPRDAGTCPPPYFGPDCADCADDGATGSESISFEGATGWPSSSDTCGGRSALTLSGLTLRSRQGAGTVLICAPSTFNGLTSRHVQLEASSALGAELTFAQPVTFVSFDFGAGLNALSLEVLADGASVKTLELSRKSKDAVALELSAPARVIGLRSRSDSTQTVGIDNIVYRYQQCE